MKFISYRAGFKYALAEPYNDRIPIKPAKDINTWRIKLTRDGDLTITAGYSWDGPSGPTVDTNNFMRGSLVHDALYELIRADLLDAKEKDAADRLLQQMCIDDGMSSVRAWWVYQGVARFGGSSIRPSAERPVLRAP